MTDTRRRYDAATAVSVANLNADLDQNRRNLARNASMEGWSGGGGAAPDCWEETLNGGTVSPSTVAGTFKVGTTSCKLTQTSAGAGDTRVELPLYGRLGVGWRGEKVAASVWVKCASAATAKLRIDDGAATAEATHTGGGGWERLAVALEVDSAASSLKVVLEVAKPLSGSVEAWFDGVTVTLGDSEGRFSENPEERSADAVDFDNNGSHEKIRAPRMLSGTSTFSLTGGAATETKTVTFPRALRTVKCGVATLKVASGTLDDYHVRIAALTRTQITFLFRRFDGSNLAAAAAPVVDWMVFGVAYATPSDQY